MKQLFLATLLSLLSTVIYSQNVLIRNEKVTFDQPFAQARATNEVLPTIYRYVHFTNIPDARTVALFEDKGLVLLEYIADKTYLVGLSKELSPSFLKEVGIDGLVRVAPDTKLSPKIKERPIPEWANAAKGQVKISVQAYMDISPLFFKRWLDEQNWQIDFVGKHQAYAELTVTEAQIEHISNYPHIACIDWIPSPGKVESYAGRGMHRSNVLDAAYAGGRMYDGSGVNVLVRDDAAIGPHIDFEGRLDQDDFDITNGYNHGDMVAGILCGAGNIEPSMKGMAPGSFLYFRRYNPHFQDYTLDLHLNNNVVVTSSSYSNSCNDGYTVTARNVDVQLTAYPKLVHIFSAGNTGQNDCDYGISGWGNITGGHKQSKNSIAVGNLNPSIDLVTSSSRGPAYDGRIKPDLCANGQGQLTTEAFNKYKVGGGTSAAAPSVAGVFAQLIHAYKSLHNGVEPESALIKACLLNSAIDLGNTGPDFKYGWGQINGYRAVRMLEEEHHLSGNITHGETKNHILNIPAELAQVRFMLYWPDAPAAAGAVKSLINNLDLKVIAPNGDTLLPWVLNHLPNLETIYDPATPGIDSLNNMEQVAFQTPMAGNYEIIVNGTAVPMGSQKYFVVHSIVDDPLFLAYPVGGEQIEPNEIIRIFWDQYDMTNSLSNVALSVDNGVSWTEIGASSSGSMLWTVPEISTSKALIRVSKNGASSQSVAPFSIFYRPENLSVDTVCADGAKLKWTAVPDAVSYEVYTLGDKYMEVQGTSTIPSMNLPLTNPLDSFWFTVSAIGVDGLISERATAIFHAGDLLNCPASFDLAIQDDTNIIPYIFICEEYEIPIKIEIINLGLQDMSNFDIVYQVNGGAEVTANYPGTIASGDSILWEAMNPLIVEASGEYELKIFIVKSNDEIAANNTLSISYQVVNNSTISVIQIEENFEAFDFTSSGWSNQGEVGNYRWKKTEITGPLGSSTSAIWVDNYANNTSTKLGLRSKPIIKEGMGSMVLSFDYAYTGYDDTYFDSLKVVVFDICDDTKDTLVAFNSGGLDLITDTTYSSIKWFPTSADEWKNITILVKGFNEGSILVVEFININGFGNSLFLDNISFKPSGISINPTLTCLNQTIAVGTNIMGDGYTYEWDLKNGGGVVTGIGPHDVIYTTMGIKKIRLIVDTGDGLDTLFQEVEIMDTPSVDFDFNIGDSEVSFTSEIGGSSSVLWTFGDGQTSTQLNPTHVYEQPGDYNTCLIGTNTCGVDTICKTINVVSNLEDLNTTFVGLQLAPNPTKDILFLRNHGKHSLLLDVALLDRTGRLVADKSSAIYLASGQQQAIDVSNLPSGMYWLRIMNAEQVTFAKIIVVK